MTGRLLEVEDLAVSFSTLRGRLNVLEGVRFGIARAEILGVVGESGSGKSVSALAIMRLLGDQGAIDRGCITLDGAELTALDDAAMLQVRGRDVAMIFQEPMTSLNPVYTVGFQIAEVLIEHLGMARTAALERAAALMDEVGIPAARQRLSDYPHQLSGGMRQRVMIAMALACRPKLLIADEPTTALDVTIQAQILELIRELRDQRGTAVILITHDMGVIAEMADRVVVMYAGQVVEQAPVEQLFADPRHPYTRLLLRSVPRVQVRPERLLAIEGNIPSPAALPAGCRFHARCPDAIARCRAEAPRLERHDGERTVRCWRAAESGLRSAAEPAIGAV
jgi:oligopeptide/dipeptide ABC transporter ATP-binding protein